MPCDNYVSHIVIALGIRQNFTLLRQSTAYKITGTSRPRHVLLYRRRVRLSATSLGGSYFGAVVCHCLSILLEIVKQVR